MRRLFKSVLILSAIFLGAVSCQKEQENEDILISETSFISTSLVQLSFQTNFTARTDWKMYSNQSWIKITSDTEGHAGKHPLTFKISTLGRNEYYRKGYIYIETPGKRYSLSVTQGNKGNSNGGMNNM